MPQFREWNIEHLLEKIHCPVLVIQGENDEYGTALQVESIRSKVKGPSQTLLIPGIGHTPHKEATDTTLDATTAFMGTMA